MIIVDNSVLSAFKRLGVLDLLRQLFDDVMITPGVLDEFSRKWGREALPRWMRIGGLDELMLREAETLRLGRGEAESIVLAQRLGCLLAVDDEKARSVAKGKGIPVIGSVGILRLAYEHCPIETRHELEELLTRLSEDLYLEDWLIKWALSAEKARTAR